MKGFWESRQMLKIRNLISKIAKMRIGVYASHASFFIVLATFPALVLLLSLLRYTGLEAGVLTGFLEGFVPQALMARVEKLIISTYRATTGTLVSFSAVTALWSASRGIHGLQNGLNAIYDVQETRGWFRSRLVSAVYTLLFLVVLLLTLLLQVFGTTLQRFLPTEDSGLLQLVVNILDSKGFILLLLQTALFVAMYMALPDRKNKFSDSLPGAVLASIGWLVFSKLYSVYVENFSGYANVYGSVYAVALSMLWLYCCISIVFYGGVLNYLLMDDRREKQ